jgi:putative sigma-54 modulation protein
VVRTKRFVLKPMDVDEAIERMELLGHDFFLFQSAEEDTLCVVYRRKGGDYGLLVPERG